MIVVVAGVSGTGKSTIGEALSTALAIPFFDADDYHPQKNKNPKMLLSHRKVMVES